MDESTASSVGTSSVGMPPNVPYLFGGVASGGEYVPHLATSGRLATGGDADAQPSRPALAGAPRRPSARATHGIRVLFEDCCERLDRAIGETDPIARDNAIAQLKAEMGGLWDYRNAREQQFAEAVNLLQCIFDERSGADFSDDELLAVKEGFERLLQEPVYDDVLLNDVTAYLLGAGLDVFRELE